MIDGCLSCSVHLLHGRGCPAQPLQRPPLRLYQPRQAVQRLEVTVWMPSPPSAATSAMSTSTPPSSTTFRSHCEDAQPALCSGLRYVYINPPSSTTFSCRGHCVEHYVHSVNETPYQNTKCSCSSLFILWKVIIKNVCIYLPPFSQLYSSNKGTVSRNFYPTSFFLLN